MSTVLISGVLLLLFFFAIRSYRKTITSGCCGSSSDEVSKKIKVHDRDLSHYPYIRTLQIDGMTCQNCVGRVQNTLNSLDGVFAKVDLQKNVAVVHLKQPLPEDVLRRVISQAGYSVISIS